MQPDLQTGALWAQYRESRSADLRRELVLRYLGLVRYVVSRLGPAPRVLEQGDVMQMGVIGLLGAIDRYNPVAGVKFETFAVPRIRGAIIDELRGIDWMGRAMRARRRTAAEAERRLAQTAGRDALESEVAEALNISVDDVRRIIDAPAAPGAEAECEPADEGPGPLEQLTDEEARAALRQALRALPERERTVLALYYYENLKMSDIGQAMSITESRVSQIHAGALARLRAALAGHAGEGSRR